MGGVRGTDAIRPGAGAGHALPAAHRRTGGIHRRNRTPRRSGVLIKAQDVLENLGRVTQVFFDKTGTLTVKQPQVVRVEMLPGAATRLNEDHVLMMAGAVESYSVHILSKGIAKPARRRWPDCASGSRMASACAQSRRPAGLAMAGSIRSSRTSMKTPARAFPAR